MFEKTAYDCWKDEKLYKPIITLCKVFDDAIGGGIHIGAITELIGAPGSGKTQLCLQLCVNVQIPESLFGLEGAAVFIDTNRGFTVNRLKEIAKATYDHCEYTYRAHKIEHDPKSFNPETMMNNIHCIFCNTYLELLSTTVTLEEFLVQNPKIRLIVIDSFSYLFRTIDDADANRVQMLYKFLTELQILAERFKCAIVITNELTTRFTADNEPEMMPALGDSHTHRINFQITLGRDVNDSNLFAANIDKSFCCAEKSVTFWINEDGMRPIRSKRTRDQI